MTDIKITISTEKPADIFIKETKTQNDSKERNHNEHEIKEDRGCLNYEGKYHISNEKICTSKEKGDKNNTKDCIGDEKGNILGKLSELLNIEGGN